MIDDERLKREIDLLVVIGNDTKLKLVAKTNGGEYAGACPFCGGNDRFRVQPNAKPYPLWMCRNCTDSIWDTVVGYVAKDLKLDPKTNYRSILARIAEISSLPLEERSGIERHPKFTSAPTPADKAPSEDWQKSTEIILNNCIDRLWNDPKAQKALEYLRKERGLTDKTIEDFRLGYAPNETKDKKYPGFHIAGRFVWNGITIPCITGGEIWYIKIRKPTKPGDKNKYVQVKGSRPAIFNGDWLRGSPLALFCEGEFDCMIAHQELNDVIPCATLGSASTTPDLAVWYWYITPLKKILAVYDNDEAGEKGFKRLQELAGSRVYRYHVSGVKDLNDLFLTGSDLFDWLKPGIKEFLVSNL